MVATNWQLASHCILDSLLVVICESEHSQCQKDFDVCYWIQQSLSLSHQHEQQMTLV